jgi:hypothetical protein
MTAKLHLGQVEPHSGLLTLPATGQSIYKIMKAERLIEAIAGQYLHFNRVDRYSDFPGADPNDGAQLPADLAANQAAEFTRGRQWTLADYYNQARGRTYASCFSLENSEHIWREYANGATHGKVCVVFDFDKLRARLNHTIEANARLLIGKSVLADQIFSVNYGTIDYVDRPSYRANDQYHQNPITYTFIKDKSFERERELRIVLSALGIGQFVLRDESELHFPDSLRFGFDFRAGIANGVIAEILCAEDADRTFIHTELAKLGLVGYGNAVPGAEPSLS